VFSYEQGSPVSQPLSSEYGTYKTVKARFWHWISGRVLKTLSAVPYRGTSRIRKRTSLGPYRRPMPRVLGGS
jgi:hypothetical protein